MRILAICDDEPLHRERLADGVRRHLPEQACSLQLFESPSALLDAIVEHGCTPNIAILDIQMDEMSGIELAKRINAVLPQCAIIFATSYLGFATDVYETEHAYFILKREFEQRIGAALEKALAKKAPPILHYPAVHGYRNVPCSQVLCLERILRRTKLTLLDGVEEWTPLTPTELLDADATELFIRCHQSYWVNFRQIETMENDCFLLTGNLRVPISRTYRSAAREQFFSSLHM